jgi:hypothetical protein
VWRWVLLPLVSRRFELNLNPQVHQTGPFPDHGKPELQVTFPGAVVEFGDCRVIGRGKAIWLGSSRMICAGVVTVRFPAASVARVCTNCASRSCWSASACERDCLATARSAASCARSRWSLAYRPRLGVALAAPPFRLARSHRHRRRSATAGCRCKCETGWHPLRRRLWKALRFALRCAAIRQGGGVPRATAVPCCIGTGKSPLQIVRGPRFAVVGRSCGRAVQPIADVRNACGICVDGARRGGEHVRVSCQHLLC